MIILGLTGSIGMGKSTTANMFRMAGVPVHDADATVHALYQTKDVIRAIEEAFPGTTSAQGVDRQALGKAVLGNVDAVRKLELIVHPLVRKAEIAFLNQQRAFNEPLVVLDIPLLFETGGNKRVDQILVVTAPAEIQRQRVLSRQAMTEERFNAILAKQMPDSEKRENADYIIDTSQGMDVAENAVAAIINELTHNR